MCAARALACSVICSASSRVGTSGSAPRLSRPVDGEVEQMLHVGSKKAAVCWCLLAPGMPEYLARPWRPE